MENNVRIMALGGLDENGKNLYVVEVNDDIFVLECGMKFPLKHNTGIDMIVPDISYLKENKERVRAYFISHGHDDIMGGLPYVYNYAPAPIYCSQRSAHMIQLTTKRLKKNCNYDFKLVTSGTTIDIKGHKIYFFSTTHSAKSSLGIAIDTGNGLVVYTGDFIFDYESLSHYRTDINLMSEIASKGVLALLTESIACNKEGFASPNHKLTPVLDSIISSNPNSRIFISLYFQNSYGFRECINSAYKYNRKIYIYGEELKTLMAETTDIELKNRVNSLRLNDNELSQIGHENVIVIVGGQGEQLFKDLEDMAIGTNSKFTFRSSDNVIIASNPVPGVEVFSSKVIDDIYRSGAKITNCQKCGVISMHARSEDMKLMISIFKPKYYLPVKGEYQNLYANAQIALSMDLGYNYSNVILLDNGLRCKFTNGEYMGIDKEISLNDMMIDGLMVGEVVSNVIDDRLKLGDDGVIVLGMCVDSVSKTIISGPDIQMRGVVFIKESDNELYRELATTFDMDVSNLLNTNKIDDEESIKQYLNELYESILNKDIFTRNVDIEKEKFIRVAKYVLVNAGNEFNAKNVVDYLNKEYGKDYISIQSIYNYIDKMKKSYLIREISRYSIPGKEILKSNPKYYAIDNGFRIINTNSGEYSPTRFLENLVCSELISRGYEVYIGKTYKGEVDFVAMKNSKKCFIQVSYIMESEETIEREFSAFSPIKDASPKYVFSLDRIDMSRNGITHINIEDYLQHKVDINLS